MSFEISAFFFYMVQTWVNTAHVVDTDTQDIDATKQRRASGRRKHVGRVGARPSRHRHPEPHRDSLLQQCLGLGIHSELGSGQLHNLDLLSLLLNPLQPLHCRLHLVLGLQPQKRWGH